mmetsp:Transcript_65597/g.58871  ORF Transcript_65597/g.58871 Transcript_65597/m.58871 type:complete len:117 (-) Transcript_65597:126-476(-)|eukprot:CAMPEP_0201575554 /NCGR_PEP_ID=MMETSP0190_2-20130828/20831_1 /ASSEMBLY_ACC=CAM_ASM_000263 /TAXON_ID=37353 /ORGANISM="Rosalina sp." /LENGTH=116 /DNA_ID=CAMNT_0048005335 /DNA_START=83 /DNA_END=433 /DNA_ORIENTATION=+
MAEAETNKQLKSPEEVFGSAATNVGGARHKVAKHTKPKESPNKKDKASESQSAAPLDKTLQASYNNVEIQGADQAKKGSPKMKAMHANAAQKAPPAKNVNGKKQNNPKINQPKQGY